MQIASERFDIARSLKCVTSAFGSYRGDDDGGHSDVDGVGERGDGLVHHVHLDAKVKQMSKFQTFQKQSGYNRFVKDRQRDRQGKLETDT